MPKKQKTFTAHKNLIHLVIERQAGTIAKSALEAVMNSIDAGASRIDVTVAPDRLVIRDNGKGFKTEKEIDEWFAVFGQPHEMNSDGQSTDAKYGAFRLGRGQMFAFGRNTWRSNKFELHVDIRKNGLDFDVEEHKEIVHNGCEVTVEFYDIIDPWALNETRKEIEKFCKYVDADLFVDGVQVNKPAAKQKWDQETDLAYVKISDSAARGIDIYQLGVFVETIPGYSYGVSGTVVTKEQVKVNFARNQVIRSCPRWKKITELLGVQSKDRNKRKVDLDESERMALIAQFRSKQLNASEFGNMRVFVDINERGWSSTMISRASNPDGKLRMFELDSDNKLIITFADKFNPLADRLMQEKRALVLDRSLLELFGEDEKGLVENVIRRLVGYRAARQIKYMPINSILQNQNHDYHLLDNRMLTPTEHLVIDMVSRVTYQIHSAVSRCDNASPSAQNDRVIRLGISNCAKGWTDGLSYVAIERGFLRNHLPLSEKNWNEIMHLVLHEFCHNTPSTQEHGHDTHFYRTYHDTADRIPAWARHVWLLSLAELKKQGRRLTTKQQKAVDLETSAAVLQEKLAVA